MELKERVSGKMGRELDGLMEEMMEIKRMTLHPLSE